MVCLARGHIAQKKSLLEFIISPIFGTSCSPDIEMWPIFLCQRLDLQWWLDRKFEYSADTWCLVEEEKELEHKVFDIGNWCDFEWGIK